MAGHEADLDSDRRRTQCKSQTAIRSPNRSRTSIGGKSVAMSHIIT